MGTLKYHIWTIGCQMNKAESERLAGLLERCGYLPAGAPEEADLVVLNSCVVRQGAEDRVVNKLHSLRAVKKARPELKVALTGCLVGAHTDGLKKSYPQIDYFFKPGEVPGWLPADSSALPAQSVCAYVPIIRGCDNFCSYCIVPYRRGREISRPLEEIACEVEQRAARGVKEVTLLGQNVDSYGHDLPGKPDLADLLARLNGIGGLLRIRFLTNHPKDISRKLIHAMATLDKVCEQINLPVQAGSDEVLKAMRRGYTAQRYRELIQDIRREVRGVALSTDVIVGFPGESGAQFMDTYNLLSELRFDMVHVAAYSPRPGTIASRDFADDVPPEEKKRRLEMVEKLHAGLATEINSALAGRSVEVLVEGKVKGKWQGRTRTDKLVFFSHRADYCGKLVKVLIDQTSPWSLRGTIDEKGEK